MTLDNILDEIKKADSIVLLTHENPDGDAIGTSLALYNALKQYGKNPDNTHTACSKKRYDHRKNGVIDSPQASDPHIHDSTQKIGRPDNAEADHSILDNLWI